MKTFYKLLGAALIAVTTNNFVWFALTYFSYLSTKSVITTGVIAGTYLVATVFSGFWLGSLVDHHKKKNILIGSSAINLVLFIIGFLILILSPAGAFSSVTSPYLWVLIVAILAAAISGSVYNIAIPTLVTRLVPEDQRSRANGLFGTVIGISFALTSVASGLVLGFGSMTWVLGAAIVLTIITIIYLIFVSIPEKSIIHTKEHPEQPQGMDIRGTLKIVFGVPGLFALIIFNTFNNFLGGVFMALMDAYGLSLVSVQVWGGMFGVLSLGFIGGGLIAAKFGLGKNPLKTMFLGMIVMWVAAAFFTVQPSIILLGAGILVWITLIPIIEAAEQTVYQKVVPPERQGRVFGFSQSIEQVASPLTAFLIGPLTQIVFIPFMTTGAGADMIGSWYGVGPSRGIALVFTIAGIIGLVITIIAMRSKYYKLLSNRYLQG